MENVDVGQLLDEGRGSGYQRWLVLLTALTIIFDGIDNQLLGVAIPTIMREWSIQRTALAPVVSLGYVGMMIGGAAAGLAGDRYGRRTALIWSMVAFGATTTGSAFVFDTSSLGALRLLAGVGLGGAMPNAAALVAEYVPKRQRPIAVTVTIVCVPLGAMIAGLLGIRLIEIIGWRGLFALGGIAPIAAAAILRRLLPESPRFLARHPDRWDELTRNLHRMGHVVDGSATFVDAQEASTSRAPITALVQSEFRADTLALWGAAFSCLLAVYLAFSWIPTLFASVGFANSVGNTGITAFNLGGVAGALIGGFAIVRFGSKTSMLAMAAGASAAAIGLSVMSITPAADVARILAVLAIAGGLVNATQTAMYALAAHVYPTNIRATGVGMAVGLGRLGAVASGYAGAFALDVGGSTAFFRLMAAAMAATFAGLAMIKRHIGRARPFR